MRYGPNDRPSAQLLLVYGLQWVATATYPFIFGLAAVGLQLKFNHSELTAFTSATLFTIGLASLVQSLWGHRLAIISGPSILPALTIAAAVNSGTPLSQVWGAIVAASIAVGLLSLFGVVALLRRVLTPLALGALIMLIGLAIATIGMGLAADLGPLGFGLALLLGLGTGLISIYARGVVSTLGVLMAVVVGYLIFAATGQLNWQALSTAPIVQLPQFAVPALPGAAIFITMLIALLANAALAVGNGAAAAELAGGEFSASAAKRTVWLNAGIEGVLPPLIGAAPLVPYAISLGAVTLTRVATRYAVAVSGAILIVMSFFGPGAALLAAVPHPVAGAVLLGVAGPQIGIGARLWGAGTRSFDARRLFIASTAVFVAFGGASLPATFFAALPDVLAQVLRNPVIAGLLYVILFEQILFRFPARLHSQ
jgi:xanthine/uracil permease